MRIGSHSVPFRVVLASASLTGLGIAVALPTIATDVSQNGVDPIITQSLSKTDSGEATLTDLPAELDEDVSATPRQILPHAPEAVLAEPHTVAEAAETADDAIEVPVMMNGDQMAMAGMPAESSSAGLASSTAGEAANGGGVVLALDHARVMRVVGDVSTIVIGNPAIADASMPDPGTIILTGKSYGETNMVMLDQDGAVLAEEMIRVTVRGQSLVSVYRGVQRTTLSCAPTCEIRPTPGYAPDMVEAGLSAFEARNQAALQAVRGGE